MGPRRSRLRDGAGIGSVAFLVLLGISSSTALRPGIIISAGRWPAQVRGLDTALSVFYNAHLIGVDYTSFPGRGNVFLDPNLSFYGYLPPTPVWLIPPVVVLCLGGAIAVRRVRGDVTTRGAFVTGAHVTVGYAPLVAIGTAVIAVDPLVAVPVAGIAYPVVCGGAGGYLQHRLGRRTDTSTSAETSQPPAVERDSPGSATPAGRGWALRNGIGLGSAVAIVLFGLSSSSALQAGIVRRENGGQPQYIGLDTTVSVFYNSQLVGVDYGPGPGTTNVFLDSRFFLRESLLPAPLWLVLPVLVLCLGGAAAARRAGTGTTTRAAVASGSSIAVGYLPFVAAGTAVVPVDPLAAVLVAGITYPVAWGGAGGYLHHRLQQGTDGIQTPSGARVEMTDDLAFAPDAIEISAGDTVSWENVGSVTHTVTAYEESIPDAAEYFASGEFDSEGAARDAYPDGGIESGEAYTHTFEVPGSYEYFCVPQEDVGMTGTVDVRPAVDGHRPGPDRQHP